MQSFAHGKVFKGAAKGLGLPAADAVLRSTHPILSRLDVESCSEAHSTSTPPKPLANRPVG